MAVSVLSTRLLLSWNLVALPAMAMIPLSCGHAVCRRVLASPGVEAPLAGLFQLIDSMQ